MERIGHVTDWWTGLEPADTSCAAAAPVIGSAGSAGELVACDHGDPEDERALAALAGERCACIELLDAWARHDGRPARADPRPRDVSDPARSSAWVSLRPAPAAATCRPARRRRGPAAAVRARGSGRFPVYPRSWDEGEAELIALLGLGGGVAERLVATVAATWARRLRPDANVAPVAVPRLRSALHARLLATLRGWLGEPRCRSRSSWSARTIRARCHAPAAASGPSCRSPGWPRSGRAACAGRRPFLPGRGDRRRRHLGADHGRSGSAHGAARDARRDRWLTACRPRAAERPRSRPAAPDRLAALEYLGSEARAARESDCSHRLRTACEAVDSSGPVPGSTGDRGRCSPAGCRHRAAAPSVNRRRPPARRRRASAPADAPSAPFRAPSSPSRASLPARRRPGQRSAGCAG